MHEPAGGVRLRGAAARRFNSRARLGHRLDARLPVSLFDQLAHAVQLHRLDLELYSDSRELARRQMLAAGIAVPPRLLLTSCTDGPALRWAG